MVSDLPVFQQNCHIRYGLNPKKGRICVAWVWNREGTEKFVNGKQHSVWFVPTGMNGLPQNVLLNFRLEFPKSDLTIYLPSGISEIFCQMVSTPVLLPFLFGRRGEKNAWYIYFTESGFLSDWSKNKRSFVALRQLVKQHILLPVLLDTFCHLRPRNYEIIKRFF